MFARKLQPGEYWHVRRIMAVAFEEIFDQGKELEREKSIKDSPKEDLYGASLTSDKHQSREYASTCALF